MSSLDSLSILPPSIAPYGSLSFPASARQAASAGAQTSASSNTLPDRTSLSSAGVLLTRALDQPEVRTARVAQLQQAIAAGTYHVSSSDLADNLIDNLAGIFLR